MIIPFAKMGAVKSDVSPMPGAIEITFTNSGEEGAVDGNRI